MAPGQSPAVPSAKRPGRLQQWWLDRSVQAKALTVLAVPLIALVGTTSASLVLEHDERSGRANSLKAFNLITAGEQVLSDAINAETGVRGYVATGNQVFLDPYNLALARIGADRKAFAAAAVARGVVRQQGQVDDTAAKVLADLAQLRTAASHGASASSLSQPLLQGKTDMDRLRTQIAGLSQAPQAELVAGRSSTSSLESEIAALDIAGLALGVLAAIAGIALFTVGISRRVDAAAANADRLGQGLPLAPAGRSRDELGRLACALGRAEQLLDSRAADLTAARDEAVRATQAKNAFLSSTSHELRTPLNSILGFTQLLEMSELSGEDQDSVQRILAAGRHLLALINELIDIARIESGDLSATSALGAGSEFTISLPRAPDLEISRARDEGSPDSEPTQPLPTRRAARPSANLWVLYIEDNPSNVEVVARYLRSRTHAHLASYPSGREGYEYAAANRPDIILLDLHRQDLHGAQTLTRLKSDPVTAGIPVVVLSADASPGMIRRLIAAGALASLTKPLDLNELGAILDSLPATASAPPFAPPSVPVQGKAPDDRVTGRDQPPEGRL